MSFLFYIDSQLTDQPDNDRDLVTGIKYDPSLKARLITQDVRLQYSGNNNPEIGTISGYNYLRSLYDSGVCQEAVITIYYQESPLATYLYYTGVIRVPDLEIDLQRENIKAQVSDNSYYSYIKNNQSIEVDLAATQSKNKIAITQLNEYSCDMFNGEDGVRGSVIGAYFRCFRVYDVFRFLVAAITDNKVGFESTYLTSSDTEIFLFKGQSIYTSYTLFPLAPVPQLMVSFKQLLYEIDVQKCLGFYIDMTDPNAPVLRLENVETLYGAPTGVTLTDIKDMRVQVSIDNLFSKVLAGSTKTIDGQSTWFTFVEATSYFGFKQESFHTLGQCNIDKELSLVNEFVISNNVIMDTLIGQGTEQIDSLFLIECNNIDTGAFTCDAVDYPYFGDTTEHLYNMGLNNFSKFSRHGSLFQTNLANFLGIGGNGFRALLGDDALGNITYSTAPGVGFIPPGGTTFDAEFANETTGGGYDGGGNYDNVTFEYTLPSDGDYSFTEQLRFAIAGLYDISTYVELTLTINHYDSGMVLKSSDSQLFTYNHDGGYIQGFTYAISGNSGDIIKAFYRIQFFVGGGGGSQPIYQFLQLSWDSYFEANGTPDGGITIASGSAEPHEYSFDYPLDDATYRLLIAAPTGSIDFEKDAITRTGWIKEFKRNDQTGLTQLKLIAYNAITTQ